MLSKCFILLCVLPLEVSAPPSLLARPMFPPVDVQDLVKLCAGTKPQDQELKVRKSSQREPRKAPPRTDTCGPA